MEIVRIILVGIITCVASMVLKNMKPELSLLVSICGGLVILVMIINSLTGVLSGFSNIVSKTSINTQLFSSVLKIVGIGYLTEFGANICQDSGNSSLADKILLAGKVIIMCFALPIVNSMLNVIIGLIKWERF